MDEVDEAILEAFGRICAPSVARIAEVMEDHGAASERTQEDLADIYRIAYFVRQQIIRQLVEAVQAGELVLR